MILLGLLDCELRLPHQTRQMRESRRPAAHTPSHEALLRFPMEGLRAEVARLALRVLGARLDRGRHGLTIFLCNVVSVAEQQQLRYSREELGHIDVLHTLCALVLLMGSELVLLISEPTRACQAHTRAGQLNRM